MNFLILPYCRKYPKLKLLNNNVMCLVKNRVFFVDKTNKDISCRNDYSQLCQVCGMLLYERKLLNCIFK